VPVQIDGIRELFYTHVQNLAQLESALEQDRRPARAILMAPLDNLLWERRLLKELFDLELTHLELAPQAQQQVELDWLRSASDIDS